MISCVQMQVWNTATEVDFEVEGLQEISGAETAAYYTEIFDFLKFELGKGVYSCIVKVTITFDRCNNPFDPEEWNARAEFELLAFEFLENRSLELPKVFTVEELAGF